MNKEKILAMARRIIGDMAREEAGMLRMEMRELDHTMDHLGRDLEALWSRKGAKDAKEEEDSGDSSQESGKKV